MADTKISALAGGSPALATDYVPAVRGAGNVKLLASSLAIAKGAANTVQLSDGAGALLAGTGVTSPGTGQLALAAGTIATSQPGLNVTQTLSAAGTTFHILDVQVVNTASNSASTYFRVRGGAAGTSDLASVDSFGLNAVGLTVTGGATLSSGAIIGSTSCGYYTSGMVSASNFGFGPMNAPVAFLTQDAANTLAQRNGATAQTFRAYKTYTDASNYERGVFDWTTTANTLTIGTQAAGTGTARSVALVAATVIVPDGSVVASGAPGLRFNAHAGTGFGANAGGGGGNIAVWLESNIELNLSLNSFRVRRDSFFGWASSTNNNTAVDTGMSRNAAGVVEVNTGTAGVLRDLRLRSVIQVPPASITPATNGDYVVEATANTTLTFKLKGTDGTVRTATLTLA